MNQIENLARERGIPWICHFTRISNFRSILGTGHIISRNELDQNDDIYFQANDPRRADGHKNKICCSITRPNPWLLQKWKDAPLNEDEFIIICIDTSVLNDSCLFSSTNAATRSGQYVKGGTDGFNAMFAETVPSIHLDSGEKYRRSDLRHDLTTDEQAEVLVPNAIDIEYLVSVIVENQSTERRVSDDLLPYRKLRRVKIRRQPHYFNWKNSDRISSTYSFNYRNF